MYKELKQIYKKKTNKLIQKDMDESGNHHSQQTDKRTENQTPHVLTHRQSCWLISTIPAFWEAKAGGLFEPKSSRPAWATWQNPIFTKKYKRLAGHGGTYPLPAEWEAEVGGSPETTKSRLQWAMIAPLHSSLGSKARCYLKKHFGRPRRVDHLGSGVQDQPDQHGETPSLLKIQKLTGVLIQHKEGNDCVGQHDVLRNCCRLFPAKEEHYTSASHRQAVVHSTPVEWQLLKSNNQEYACEDGRIGAAQDCSSQ
ncbi:putative uncharacterized protein C8orf44 [Plecturocebus cupreus]